MSSRATARAARPPAAQLSADSVPGVVLSLLALPNDALVLCSSFAPLGDPATHTDSIEQARRRLHAHWRQPSLTDSLLAHVDSSSHDTRLHVFALASRATQSARPHALGSLALHNLIAVDSTSFDFRQLYSSNNHSPAFVTPGLHRLYLMFLAALRSRILADICDTPNDRIRASHVRMRDGFLLVPRPVDSEWSVGWDDPQRRLAYCHLHLHWMNPSTIVLRPVFSTSPYSQLSPKQCPAGQPIALLPYAVPAYFIAPYTGSTAALSQHFRDSLVGLGVGPTWEVQGYILCWIAVHNSQGDDKAVLAVWPAALAVACPDRPLADRLPTVPDHFAPAVSASVAERSFAAPRAQQRSLPIVIRQAGELSGVANTVANYIEALTKERERERERAKEERYRRLQVSVPQPGSAPRSRMSGSAGAPAAEHFRPARGERLGHRMRAGRRRASRSSRGLQFTALPSRARFVRAFCGAGRGHGHGGGRGRVPPPNRHFDRSTQNPILGDRPLALILLERHASRVTRRFGTRRTIAQSARCGPARATPLRARAIECILRPRGGQRRIARSAPPRRGLKTQRAIGRSTPRARSRAAQHDSHDKWTPASTPNFALEAHSAVGHAVFAPVARTNARLGVTHHAPGAQTHRGSTPSRRERLIPCFGAEPSPTSGRACAPGRVRTSGSRFGLGLARWAAGVGPARAASAIRVAGYARVVCAGVRQCRVAVDPVAALYIPVR